MSQAAEILAYLKAGHTLTKLESIQLFGCMNLGGRVFDLHKTPEGRDIQTEMIELPNGKRVAQYFIPLPRGQLSLFQTKSPQDFSYGLSDDRSLGMDHNKSASCQAAASAAKRSNANRCRPLAADGVQRTTLGVSG